MNKESNITIEPEEDVGEFLKTPERPEFSPLAQDEANNENEKNNDSNNTDNKTEQQNVDMDEESNNGISQPTVIASTEYLNKQIECVTESEESAVETQKVRVREEPLHEIKTEMQNVDMDKQSSNGISQPAAVTPTENLNKQLESVTENEESALETQEVRVREESLHVIKTETEDIDINEDITNKISQPAAVAPTENLNKQVESVIKSDECALETQEVGFGEDMMHEANAIECDMPLSKTPYEEYANMENPTDVSSNINLNQNRLDILNENISKATHFDELQAKTAALDEFLDGTSTSIASVTPRLRVKTEFSLMANTDNILLPPPAPFIGINSNADAFIDGISTPHLSLAAPNRLRVKSEFSTPLPYTEDSKELGEMSSSNSDIASEEEEEIPDDYFDDLIVDKTVERIAAAQNTELEEKYSERLKEYERLAKISEKKRDKHKSHKKQKKSKKRSHRRSRSRSLSPNRKAKQSRYHDDEEQIKRSHCSQLRDVMPTCSRYAIRDRDDICLRATTTKHMQIKSEFTENSFLNKVHEPADFIENVVDIPEVLTPREKRDRAIERATALRRHLEDSSNDNPAIFSTFAFVSTLRKLPTSHSYVQQQMHENRSPLHTTHNVNYKFNSHNTHFNFEEWGLASLPKNAAKLAKLIGCSAQHIHNKLKTMKIPPKLKNMQQEPKREPENEQEELIESSSSLYANAMTQTDCDSEFESIRKTKGYEIGIQAVPALYSVGCQTLETQLPTENVHKDDDAPIMQLIRDLNENQLMALHAFAELIKVPNGNTNAMEMYKLQMQIVDIYKMSQRPSAIATEQTQAVNNYRTTTTTTTRTTTTGAPQGRMEGAGGTHLSGHRQPPIMHIQSVVAGDGTEFVVNDPRTRSASYAKRIGGSREVANSSSNFDPRYLAFSQPSQPVISSPNDNYSFQGRPPYDRSLGLVNGNRYYGNDSQRPYPLNQQIPAPTTKRYGRGAARR